MLEVAKGFLKEFDEKNIRYCVIKSIEHLESDLKGNRGDLDLLIHTNDLKVANSIIQDNGFYKVLCPREFDGVGFYFGYDFKTSKHLLLHIHTKLRIGGKEKRFHWLVEDFILKERIIDKKTGVYVINPIDEFYLLMFRLLLKGDNYKSDDVMRLNYLTKTINPYKRQANQQLENLIKDSIESLIKPEYSQDILKELSDKYINNIINTLTNSFTAKIKIHQRVLWHKINNYLSIVKRKLRCPNYRIMRKGKIVAFQGVDGSGKSTQVEKLLNVEFFCYTGIKRIYAGNNEYWIPGLFNAMNKINQNKKIEKLKRLFLNILVFIDRRSRVLKAIYYSINGNTVVFDRYFYDDLSTIEKTKITKEKKFVLIKLYQYLLYGWLGLKPDIVFFLDISAIDAYERKRDYPLSLIELQVEAYRKVFKDREEVICIDALKSVEQIHRIVTYNILKTN